MIGWLYLLNLDVSKKCDIETANLSSHVQSADGQLAIQFAGLAFQENFAWMWC